MAQLAQAQPPTVSGTVAALQDTLVSLVNKVERPTAKEEKDVLANVTASCNADAPPILVADNLFGRLLECIDLVQRTHKAVDELKERLG